MVCKALETAEVTLLRDIEWGKNDSAIKFALGSKG